jgi:hypothetical protein
MAVVFISPKKRQQTFFVVGGIGVLLFVGLITLLVFAWGPSSASLVGQYNKPKVVVNLGLLDQTEVKNLTYFDMIPLQFSYTAQTKAGKKVTGLISSDSQEDAQAALVKGGLQVGQLTEIEPGRSNPFIPY